jgi:hypothetical protein
MKKSKMDHLKAHLASGKSITQLEALGLYGMFRLAARIKELREAGWAISTDMREDPNGNKYAAYILEDAPTHGLPSFARPDRYKDFA